MQLFLPHDGNNLLTGQWIKVFFLLKYNEHCPGYAFISGDTQNIALMHKDILRYVEHFCTPLFPHNQISSMTFQPVSMAKSCKYFARCIFCTIFVNKILMTTLFFHIIGLLWREHQSLVDYSHQGPVMWSFDLRCFTNSRLASTLMRSQCNIFMFAASRQTCTG